MSTVSTTVNVSGMTCGHCVSSVSEELESLAGVEAVDVDLNAGGISTVTITSSQAPVTLRDRRSRGRGRLPGRGQRGLTSACPGHRAQHQDETGKAVSTRATLHQPRNPGG